MRSIPAVSISILAPSCWGQSNHTVVNSSSRPASQTGTAKSQTRLAHLRHIFSLPRRPQSRLHLPLLPDPTTLSQQKGFFLPLILRGLRFSMQATIPYPVMKLVTPSLCSLTIGSLRTSGGHPMGLGTFGIPF